MQIIAGIVEHRLSDYLISYNNGPLLVNALSFTVRTINSYWGTQVSLALTSFPMFLLVYACKKHVIMIYQDMEFFLLTFGYIISSCMKVY